MHLVLAQIAAISPVSAFSGDNISRVVLLSIKVTAAVRLKHTTSILSIKDYK